MHEWIALCIIVQFIWIKWYPIAMNLSSKWSKNQIIVMVHSLVWFKFGDKQCIHTLPRFVINFTLIFNSLLISFYKYINLFNFFFENDKEEKDKRKVWYDMIETSAVGSSCSETSKSIINKFTLFIAKTSYENEAIASIKPFS